MSLTYPNKKVAFRLYKNQTYYVPVSPVEFDEKLVNPVVLARYNGDGFVTVRQGGNGTQLTIPVEQINQSQPILKGPRSSIPRNSPIEVFYNGRVYPLKFGQAYEIPLKGDGGKVLQVVYKQIPTTTNVLKGKFVSKSPHPHLGVHYIVPITSIDVSRNITKVP